MEKTNIISRRTTRSSSKSAQSRRSLLTSVPEEEKRSGRRMARSRTVTESSTSITAGAINDKDVGTESCGGSGSSATNCDFRLPRSSPRRGMPPVRRSSRISDLTKVSQSEGVENVSSDIVVEEGGEGTSVNVEVPGTSGTAKELDKGCASSSDFQPPRSSSRRVRLPVRTSGRISDLTKVSQSEGVEGVSSDSVMEEDAEGTSIGTEPVTSGTAKDSKEEYVVEKVVAKKVMNGTAFYRIKWKGWNEKYNTWEPLKHLDGCQELLEEFEKKEAERKGTRRNRLEATKSQIKCFEILTEWPSDKVPISVEGAVFIEGTLTYVVKRDSRGGSDKFHSNNAVFVEAKGFRYLYPELVIQFYASRVVFTDNLPEDEEKRASVAAHIANLKKNLGPLGGDVSPNNEDKKEVTDKEKNVNKDKQATEEPPEIILSSDSDDDDDDEKMDEDDGQQLPDSVHGEGIKNSDSEEDVELLSRGSSSESGLDIN